MKYRDLGFLIIGVIITLIIFEVNIPIFQTLQLDLSISTTWIEILTAIGTIGATVAAVFFGLGGKENLLKPDMKIIGHHENKQANSSTVEGHTRLKFINEGKSTAKNVNVYVEEIIDNGISRGHFLPVPLSWTHNGMYFRDFPPKQVWFLDLCRIDNIDSHKFPILVLAAGQNVDNYQNLNEGKTMLFLKVSDESGRIRRYKLTLKWQIGEPYVIVKRISELS